MEPIEHGYDWAWADIRGANVRSNGGTFAVRYLGGSARLTAAQRDELHAANVNILLVFEQEATLAEGGFSRGVTAAMAAIAEATELGYPPECPIFFADDNNDADPSQEVAFFRGVVSVFGSRPFGVYSGGNVCAAVVAVFPNAYTWRVETWFPDMFESPDLEQLANTRDPAMLGISQGDYDTNLEFHSIPMWGPNGVVHGTAAAPTSPKEEDMPHVAYIVTPNGHHWCLLVNGGFMDEDFGISTDADFMNVPAACWAWVNQSDTTKRVEFVQYHTAGWDRVRARSVTPTVSVDTSALEAKVSAWFGQLQDHLDASIAAGGSTVDLKALIDAELSRLSLTLKDAA